MPPQSTPEVDLQRGLDPAAVEKSRAEHGANVLTAPPRTPMWLRFLKMFQDDTIIVLCAAAAISLLVSLLPGAESHSLLEGFAILVAVLIATFVGFINEYRSEREFELLQASSDRIHVKVRRNGTNQTVLIDEVVVGDVVVLGEGDKLPADCEVHETHEMCVDQSLFTGESEAVRKGPEDRLLMRGTTVAEGHGVAVVTAVGDKTELGKIKDHLDSEAVLTPLQEQLTDLSEKIGLAGMLAATLTFLAMTVTGLVRGELGLVALWYAVGTPVIGATFLARAKLGKLVWLGYLAGLACLVAGWYFGEPAAFKAILGFFIIAVTIIVVAVPEGLPLAVTISLAYNMRRMARENCLVRTLKASETMGSVSVICSDKTGTLTRNQMVVRQLFVGGQQLDAAAAIPAPLGEAFALGASVNSTAFIKREGTELKYIGSSTEAALLRHVAEQGHEVQQLRETHKPLKTIPFSSKRKFMASLVELDGERRLLVKGAPEVVLAMTSGCLQGGPWNENTRTALDSWQQELSSTGHRLLALAERKLDAELPLEKGLEDLQLVAIAAIADPLRADIPEVLETARRAGVEVKMLTGDNKVTAMSIARQAGLLEEDGMVIEGAEFRQLSDAELDEILPHLRVLARSTPQDKLRLVKRLRENGASVAVTGDGTNDAPALKKADVGLSMGSGTDLAKEASDIVLLDDSFNSIVNAILWGRSLYENIQKFLQFQLTVNVAALVTAFFGALFFTGEQQLPLTAIQLLWVNLIMDTLAAIALGLEPPRQEVMNHPPRKRRAKMITPWMWFAILGVGLYTFAVLVAQMQWNFLGAQGVEEGLSVIFTVFVFFQVVNEINSRSIRPGESSLKGIFKSRWFLIIVGGIALMQFCMTQFGGEIFRTVPLSWTMWAKILGLSLTVLLLGEVWRWIFRLRAGRQT